MNNYASVFKILRRVYKPIPLEVFGNNPYKVLVSVLMSARTLDRTTQKAAENLFRKAPTIFKLNALDTPLIQKLIYPVGFYKTKARHLKKLSHIVTSDFKGKIPTSRENLMKLPGVGRKTANLVLNRAFGKPAIAVDTHVHKISNLLGWVKTNSPEETERKLEKIIPERYWADLNRLFVSLGQNYRGGKLMVFLKKEGLIK